MVGESNKKVKQVPTYYGAGTHRLVYKAVGFATGLTVTAYIWNASLTKSGLQTFTEVSDGLYYLDYSFAAVGDYFGKFYEDGTGTVMGSFRVVAALSEAAVTKLEASAGTIVIGTVSWDNTNATTTVFYSDDITEATADHFNGRIVIFTTGDLTEQATDITDYQLSAGEGRFTVTALTEAPADNVTFVIV
jgi:hypothetical protein